MKAADIHHWYEQGTAWFNRGNSEVALGRDDDALTSYQRAMDAGTQEWAPFANAGRTLVRLGRHEDALACFDRYIALGIPLDEWGEANADAHLRKAQIYLEMDREADALAAIETAIGLQDDVDAWCYAADIHAIDRGVWADAVPLLTRAYEETGDLLVGIKLGIALANVGREEDALAELRGVIAEDPAFDEMIRSAGWRSALKDPSILDRL